MKARFLLPCSSCGENATVESAQAGQSILCSCGKTLEVPTMQGMRQLERQVDAMDERKTPSSFGGAAIGIALLGIVILGAGGLLTYRTYTQRPVLIELDYMTPWDTWLLWHSLGEGVQLPEYLDSPYLRAMEVYRRYMTIGIAVIVLGVVTIACAAIVAIINRPSRGRAAVQRAP